MLKKCFLVHNSSIRTQENFDEPESVTSSVTDFVPPMAAIFGLPLVPSFSEKAVRQSTTLCTVLPF